MLYVGLDYHFTQSTVVVLDQNGRVLRTRKIRGYWTDVIKFLKSLKKEFMIVFEATTGYGLLFEELGRLARRVFVAHPGRLRLIFASKRKNDRVDAEKLAKILYLGEVPEVHVPGLEVRSWV